MSLSKGLAVNAVIPEFTSNEFKFVKKIGSGWFGQVFSADHDDLGKVAIKKLTSHVNKKEFTELMVLVKNSNHQNIVRCFGLLVDGVDALFYDSNICRGYIMEFMEIGSLHGVIHDKTRNYDRIQVASWIQLASSGIQYIHRQGITHRNIKPANILLGHSLNDLRISDFILDEEPLKSFDIRLPEVPYIAPEGYSQSGDVYSLAITIWEMINRRIPFYHLGKIPFYDLIRLIAQGERPALKGNSTMANLLRRGWDKDPAKRPPIAEFISFAKTFKEVFIAEKARSQLPPESIVLVPSSLPPAQPSKPVLVQPPLSVQSSISLAPLPPLTALPPSVKPSVAPPSSIRPPPAPSSLRIDSIPPPPEVKLPPPPKDSLLELAFGGLNIDTQSIPSNNAVQLQNYTKKSSTVVPKEIGRAVENSRKETLILFARNSAKTDNGSAFIINERMEWVKLTLKMPQESTNVTVEFVDGELYAIGAKLDSPFITELHKFDRNFQWQKLEDIPEEMAITNFITFVQDKTIGIIDIEGEAGLIYDTEDEEEPWGLIENLNYFATEYSNDCTSAAVVKDIIFLSTREGDLAMFDDEWIELKSTLTNCYEPSIFGIGNYLYAIGKEIPSIANKMVRLNLDDKYNSWERVLSPQVKRRDFLGFGLSNEIIVIGRDTEKSQQNNGDFISSEIFNGKAWRRGPMLKHDVDNTYCAIVIPGDYANRLLKAFSPK